MPKTVPTTGKYAIPLIKNPGCKSTQPGLGRRVMNIQMVKKVRNSERILRAASPERKDLISSEI